jgi:hypothetical protein
MWPHPQIFRTPKIFPCPIDCLHKLLFYNFSNIFFGNHINFLHHTRTPQSTPTRKPRPHSRPPPCRIDCLDKQFFLQITNFFFGPQNISLSIRLPRQTIFLANCNCNFFSSKLLNFFFGATFWSHNKHNHTHT